MAIMRGGGEAKDMTVQPAPDGSQHLPADACGQVGPLVPQEASQDRDGREAQDEDTEEDLLFYPEAKSEVQVAPSQASTEHIIED
jgi:hypothetical protein